MKKLDTVILIDDDNVANYLNQDLISGLQVTYSIQIANNGREGLEYIKKNISSKKNKLSGLILLDLQMPVMDGYEFLFHFNNLNLHSKHNLNVAILTSSLDSSTNTVNNLGAYACLQKPLTEEKLLYLLQNFTISPPKIYKEQIADSKKPLIKDFDRQFSIASKNMIQLYKKLSKSDIVK